MPPGTLAAHLLAACIVSAAAANGAGSLAPEAAAVKYVANPAGGLPQMKTVTVAQCSCSVPARDGEYLPQGFEFRITDRAGKTLFQEVFVSVGEISGSGHDLDGDGSPDGAICGRLRDGSLLTVFLSCSGRDNHVVTSTNGYGFSIRQESDGRYVLTTAQDGFEGRELLREIYHYDLLIPDVYFRLGRDRLEDVTDRHHEEYRELAVKAEQSLSANDIGRLAREPQSKLEAFDRGRAEGRLMRAITAWIYAGEPRSARALFDRAHHGPDREVFWNAIVTSINASTIGPRVPAEYTQTGKTLPARIQK